MKTPRRSGHLPTDRAAAQGGWRPSVGYLVVALGLAAASLVFLFKPSEDADGKAASTAASGSERDKFATWTPPPLPAASVMPVTNEAPPHMPHTPQQHADASSEGDQDPTRDLTFYLARGEKPTMSEVIDRLHQAGVHSGLGAFSPPGTRPPLVGLAVPEDFVLPPGYVRHYQATDDGQRIEAILMYSPDYQFTDAANQPIVIPKDRVVPPDQAPPGLPIRRIVIPPPTEPK
jgi:hypothetical protein